MPVWSFYRHTVKKDIWEKAIDKIVQKVRVNTNRTPEPSYCYNRFTKCKNNK